MNEDILSLKRENERLSRIAEMDWLTGLYNRGASEEKINQLINETKKGVMFVIDVNRFKQVNDRYGHIAGDHLLQEIARVLQVMVLPKDLVGRIGGDEFVAFMPVERDKRFAEARSVQIRDRLSSIALPDNSVELSVSVGWSILEEDDDYESLFYRADQRLLREKRARYRRGEGRGLVTGNSIEMDIKGIRQELSEPDSIKGAYCLEYETFKGLYRFMERKLHRSGGSVYIILFTVTDKKGDFFSLREREIQMGLLGESIQNCLRSADAFTQYSSGQYLIMVSEVTGETAEMIATRIQEAFYREIGDDSEEILLHHCYPLTPAVPVASVKVKAESDN